MLKLARCQIGKVGVCQCGVGAEAAVRVKFEKASEQIEAAGVKARHKGVERHRVKLLKGRRVLGQFGDARPRLFGRRP